MMLSLFVAALALQTPKPAPAPAAKPAAAPAADAKKEAKKEEGGERFLADFDEAVKVAKKEHKDLLVDFTGSDWCYWCKKLHSEVFDFDSFLDGAEEGFVLVALDFPNGEEAKKKVPNAARNVELRDKYKIGGYPTVLLMTPDGDVFAKTGYQEGGPDKYLEDVKSKTTAGKKTMAEIADLEKKIAAAKGAEHEKMIDGAIASLTGLPEDSPFASRYATLAREAFKLDPDNKKGMKLKAVDALLKTGQADADTTAAATALDPKNEKGLLEKVIETRMTTIQKKEDIEPALKALDDFLAVATFKDAKIGKNVLANATFMSKQHLADAARAKGYATKLKALGLDGPDDAKLKEFVDGVING